MKTRKEIIKKLDEYYKLPPALQLHPRNLGYCDALRWVIENDGLDYEQ